MKKTIINLKVILKCLRRLKDTLILITSPNSDAKGIVMIKEIKSFIKKNKLNFISLLEVKIIFRY